MSSGQDAEKFQEIFDRLRETEAQTREQNTRLSGLCDRLDAFTQVTDRFFELQDKRHESDEKRFESLCEHEKRLSDAAAAREDKMWKVIIMLAGALVAAAVGPKAVSEVFRAYRGEDDKRLTFNMPAIPMQQHDWSAFFTTKEPSKV